jgi:hypothetical protein
LACLDEFGVGDEPTAARVVDRDVVVVEGKREFGQDLQGCLAVAGGA